MWTSWLAAGDWFERGSAGRVFSFSFVLEKIEKECLAHNITNTHITVMNIYTYVSINAPCL